MVIALIGGGSRSGKSRFALEYAEERFERLAFVATAHVLDEEMKVRVTRHQAERGPRWSTIEEPVDVARAIRNRAEQFDIFVVDCLTLWLSNVLLSNDADPERELERLIRELAEGPPCILVTNEVGCGIVPDNALSRRFRDLAGTLNQYAAGRAQEIYWIVFGIPLRINGPPK